MSVKWLWRLQTSPFPLSWIGVAALNAQSWGSISEKKQAQHSGGWSCDQMYFCNFFVRWDCWILWTDHHIWVALETVHNHCFLSSIRHIHTSGRRSFHMNIMFPLHHYRFALFCIYHNFNPPLKIFLSKNVRNVLMMCLVSGVVDTGDYVPGRAQSLKLLSSHKSPKKQLSHHALLS